MVSSYVDELDDADGLNGYDFVLVLPYEFAGKPKSWVDKRRASQREIIRILRQEHLVCRILKSRDEDEVLVLVRAPTYEEFSLVEDDRNATARMNRAKALAQSTSTEFALPVPSFPIMDWCSFWADKLQFEFQVREVREGFKGCTLPFSFENRVLFVREGEFNPPDLIKPKRVEMPHRLPGQKRGYRELMRTENTMRRLGYKVADWDTSIQAHGVDHAFNLKHFKTASKMSFTDWRNQQIRIAKMRSSSRRQMLIGKVMEMALKKRLRNTWFCREDSLAHKRNWIELTNHQVVGRVVPLHHSESRKWFESNWSRVGTLSTAFFTAASPVNDVCAYFGEEVAFYFAFVEHYNRWLIIPAFFGSIIFMYQVANAPETLDSDALVIYMFLVSGWCTLFLESWNRKQNILSHLWGVMHIETEDSVRSEFVGEERYNHWLGHNDSCETKESFRRRPLAIPFLLFSLGCLFAFQVNMAIYKSVFKNDSGGNDDGKSWFSGGALSTGFLTFFVQEMLGSFYGSFAEDLTQKENWKTESAHTLALGTKLVSFQILNFYLVLLFTGL